MFRSILLVMVVTVISPLSSVHGQDSEEVKRLKERIELLEAKLKLAEKEVELLKKEQAMLNANDTKKPAPAPESGEDAFAYDAVLTGRLTMGEQINSIHRLELTGPPRGFVTDCVSFSNVRVVTKN